MAGSAATARRGRSPAIGSVPALRHPLVPGLLLAVLLAVCAIGTLMVGPSGLSLRRSFLAVLGQGDPRDIALVRDIRLPRLVLGVLVGANLGVAGLLSQTLTRNPLSSPQTFGINAGAALAIVLSFVAFPALSHWGTVAPALIGAAAIGAMMWSLSLSGGMTPTKLALAGIALHLVLSAMVQAVLIANNAAQDIVFWMAGSLNSAQWAKVAVIAPFTAMGLALAVVAAHHFAVLALDTQIGLSLGQNTRLVGGLAGLLIVLLAGSAVAVSGPIGFIGLMVPHLVRRLAGEDPRPLTVLCALAGALLLTGADLAGKLLAYPSEVPVGIVTAMIGAPAFLFITWMHRTR